jgi:hypothetical protein
MLWLVQAVLSQLRRVQKLAIVCQTDSGPLHTRVCWFCYCNILVGISHLLFGWSVKREQRSRASAHLTHSLWSPGYVQGLML